MSNDQVLNDFVETFDNLKVSAEERGNIPVIKQLANIQQNVPEINATTSVPVAAPQVVKEGCDFIALKADTSDSAKSVKEDGIGGKDLQKGMNGRDIDKGLETILDGLKAIGISTSKVNLPKDGKQEQKMDSKSGGPSAKAEITPKIFEEKDSKKSPGNATVPASKTAGTTKESPGGGMNKSGKEGKSRKKIKKDPGNAKQRAPESAEKTKESPEGGKSKDGKQEQKMDSKSGDQLADVGITPARSEGKDSKKSPGNATVPAPETAGTTKESARAGVSKSGKEGKSSKKIKKDGKVKNPRKILSEKGKERAIREFFYGSDDDEMTFRDAKKRKPIDLFNPPPYKINKSAYIRSVYVRAKMNIPYEYYEEKPKRKLPLMTNPVEVNQTKSSLLRFNNKKFPKETRMSLQQEKDSMFHEGPVHENKGDNKGHSEWLKRNRPPFS